MRVTREMDRKPTDCEIPEITSRWLIYNLIIDPIYKVMNGDENKAGRRIDSSCHNIGTRI